MVFSDVLNTGQNDGHPTRVRSIESCLVSSLDIVCNETTMIPDSVELMVS